MAPDAVVLRPPLVLRVYVAVFLVFWLGATVWTTMIRHHGFSIVVGVVFVVVGVLLGLRLLRLGVRGDANGTLIVRNNLGTRRLTRADIEGFRIGSTGGMRLGQRSIQVLLHDGTAYGLDVSRFPIGTGSRRLTRQVDQLHAWLHGN